MRWTKIMENNDREQHHPQIQDADDAPHELISCNLQRLRSWSPSTRKTSFTSTKTPIILAAQLDTSQLQFFSHGGRVADSHGRWPSAGATDIATTSSTTTNISAGTQSQRVESNSRIQCPEGTVVEVTIAVSTIQH
jgi:hypothetical protein